MSIKSFVRFILLCECHLYVKCFVRNTLPCWCWFCMSSAWCVIFGFVGYDFGRVATWVALFSEFSLTLYGMLLGSFRVSGLHCELGLSVFKFIVVLVFWFGSLNCYVIWFLFTLSGPCLVWGAPRLFILVWVLSLAAWKGVLFPSRITDAQAVIPWVFCPFPSVVPPLSVVFVFCFFQPADKYTVSLASLFTNFVWAGKRF